MAITKAQALSHLGKRVRVHYTQTYNSGRSESRIERGRLIKVTDHAIYLATGTINLGFGATPVESVIEFSKIEKVTK